MKVQLDKCEFMKPEVEFLGFLVFIRAKQANQKKVEAMGNFPTLKTIKELRSFLPYQDLYRRFIKDYAKFAKPLMALLRGEEGEIFKALSSKFISKFGERCFGGARQDKENTCIERLNVSIP